MRHSAPELRLQYVQDRIEMLYRDRGDQFNLTTRYDALVKLERILLETAKVPNERRARELAQLSR